MDFAFSPEAYEAAALAATILRDATTPERLRAAEADGDRWDGDLWRSLADAGLLALSIPEAHGGADLGLVEACRVVVEAGRAVAPVPIATHLAVAHLLGDVLPVGVVSYWLPRAARGEALLSAAVAEDHAWLPAQPTCTAEREGDGWRLRGTKTLMDAGMRADAFFVTASSSQGPVVVLVRPDDEGVVREPQRTSDGSVHARATLDVRVPIDRLGGGPGAVRRLHELLTLTGVAHQLGVTQGALALTAEHARTREQFGRPIGTFQAVGQRLADAYIQTLGQELTLWQAAWLLGEGREATEELASAALWAADAGHVVAHTTVHVHGGVGIDLDGTAHRYFTAAKRWEFTHGAGTQHARTLGAALTAN